jgi:hypothetical protein
VRHGQEERVLKEIASLKEPRGEAGEVVRKEKKLLCRPEESNEIQRNG